MRLAVSEGDCVGGQIHENVRHFGLRDHPGATNVDQDLLVVMHQDNSEICKETFS